MSELLHHTDKFRTFNEFFYRELKHNARPCSAPQNPGIVTSPADSRSVVFDSITDATRIWVKGRNFSVERLIGKAYPEDAKRFVNGAMGIMRLAPQDYHRFHIPVDGVMGQPKLIDGEYYTVNPMAIRSSLDVYGENIRVIVPIDSVSHGRVMVVCVGAMMVGSTVITRKAGEKVARAEELGYFKFGGSTIIVLFEKGKMLFDSDMIDNSNGAVETLVSTSCSLSLRMLAGVEMVAMAMSKQAHACLSIARQEKLIWSCVRRSESVCPSATTQTRLSMSTICARRRRTSRMRTGKRQRGGLRGAWRRHWAASKTSSKWVDKWTRKMELHALIQRSCQLEGVEWYMTLHDAASD